MTSKFFRPFAVFWEGLKHTVSSSPSEIAKRYVNFVTFILAIVLLVIFLSPRSSSSSQKTSLGLDIAPAISMVICCNQNLKKYKKTQSISGNNFSEKNNAQPDASSSNVIEPKIQIASQVTKDCDSSLNTEIFSRRHL